MITLGGIALNNNLVLNRVEVDPVVYEQKVTIEGYSSVLVQENIGGEVLTLGTDSSSNSYMGLWCLGAINQIKALQRTVPHVLDYRGEIYNVYIVEVKNFTALIKTQEETDDKKYTGSIKLIGV